MKSEILSAAERAEMADVKQIKKFVPFVTCEMNSMAIGPCFSDHLTVVFAMSVFSPIFPILSLLPPLHLVFSWLEA